MRFLPGNHANDAGRPKGMVLSERLRAAVDADALAKALLKLVSKGEMAAIAYVYDRLEGKPKQALDIQRSEDDPGVQAMRELSKRLERGNGK